MLKKEDLYSLEKYEEMRPEYRAKIMVHKAARMVNLGEHIRLYFEDQLTMQYQVQEMLRAEKIFTVEGIQEELDTYNPLISSGLDLVATMMIVYPDVAEREIALVELLGIENKFWLQIGQGDKVWALADEDLERADEDKTSAVHFMRFQLEHNMLEALGAGADLTLGVAHSKYVVEQVLPNHQTALLFN